MKNFPNFQTQIRPTNTMSTPKRDIECKRSFPKQKSKEKDQTASTEYPTTTATKITFFIHSGKGNNSSIQNYSETTLNSQLFKDSGLKDLDLKTVRLTPPKVDSKKAKTVSGSPRVLSHEANTRRQKAIDLERILTSKDREIKNLEELTVTMNKEIHQAVNFLERNKDVPYLLEEKEKEAGVLHNKLGMILQEIDHLKFYTKARSIPNLQDTLREYRNLEKLEDSQSQRAFLEVKETLRRDRNQIHKHNVNQVENQETIDAFSYRDGIQKRETVKNNPYLSNPLSIADKTQIYKARNTANVRKSPKNDSKNYENPALHRKAGICDNVGDGDPKKKEHKGEFLGSKSHRGKGDQEQDMNPLMKLLKNLQRSLSPGEVHNYQNRHKYQMYTEDPVKKLVPQYLKSKQLRQVNKDTNPDTSSLDPNKNKNPALTKDTYIEDTVRLNVEKNEKSQTKKKINHRGASSLSPVREKSITQKMKIAKGDTHFKGLKASPKANMTAKKNANQVIGNKTVGGVKGKEKDIAQDVNNLLEEFYFMADKYKRLTKILRNKNQRLKQEVRDISEGKIKVS